LKTPTGLTAGDGGDGGDAGGISPVRSVCFQVSTELVLVILPHFSSLPGLTNDRERDRERKRALTRTPTRTPNLC
jgi:hypothetical protein